MTYPLNLHVSAGAWQLFAKRKKAENFIAGRRLLKSAKTQVVTDISKILNRLKVDY